MLLLLGTIAQGSDFPVSLDRNNLRFTYDNVTLPGDESMGLVGLNYQMQVGAYGYGGLGVYGAAAGERGGFFVGGFEGGLRYPFLSGFEAEAGMFVGGGGGGAAPQGGGLMLRPHVGISYGNDAFRAGVQLSRVEFPDGDISSTQIAGVVDIPFESFRIGSYRGNMENLSYDLLQTYGRYMAPVQGEFGIELQRYYPQSGSRRTDGSELSTPFETLGVSYERYWTRNLSWHLSTAGALGGGSDGYAEIFGGGGWRYGLFDSATTRSRLFLDLKGSVGMAGGGRVDTGGGTLLKGSLGLSYRLGDQSSLYLRGGVAHAVDGRFDARFATGGLSYTFVSVEPVREATRTIDRIPLIRREWEARAVHETYTSAGRKNGRQGSISLVGLQANATGSRGRYLYGKAMGAYTGEAGGYAAGSVGAGGYLPIGSAWGSYLQAGAGAAGGGGIDVAGGAFVEAEAGLKAAVGTSWDIYAGAGVIRSVYEGLESPTFKAGVAYRFGTMGSRRPLY